MFDEEGEVARDRPMSVGYWFTVLELGRPWIYVKGYWRGLAGG